jgi:hypothetical protein
MYLDSLSTARKLDVSGEAPKLMRAAFLDRNKSFRSTERVASYQGGELTVADYMRWATALGPQFAAQLQQANDSALTQFAKVIGQNTLLLRPGRFRRNSPQRRGMERCHAEVSGRD